MRYLLPLASLIQPVITLVLAFIQNSKKNTGYFLAFCIALGFSTIAMELQPTPDFDIYRQYRKFGTGYAELSLLQTIDVAEPGYKLFNVLIWSIERLELPKHTLVFLFVFTYYYLIFSVFTNLKKYFLWDNNQHFIFLSLLTIWLNINFVDVTSNLRNPLASSLMVYATYHLFFSKRYLLFIPLSLLAFLIHPFALSYSLIAIISYTFSNWSGKAKWLLYLAFCIALFNSYMSSEILSYLSIFEGYNWFKPVYFEDEFIEDRVNRLNSLGILTDKVIPSIPIILSYCYLISNKAKPNNPLYLLLCGVFILFSIFIENHILVGRINLFFSILFAIYLILELSNSNIRKKHKLFAITYFSSLCIYSLIYFFLYRDYIFSAFPKALLPFLLVFFETT